jgi:hypothetical protein
VAFAAVAIIASVGSIKDTGSLNLYQFGAVVYNPQEMSKAFSNRESSALKAECASIYQTLL